MTDQATPRPWLLDTLEGGGWAVVVEPTPTGAQVVAELDDTTGNRAANAALIVRAVNAHDDLVAELLSLASFAEECGRSSVWNACERARALVARLEDPK